MYLFVPLTVWLMAFLVWFYWFDLRDFFVKDQASKTRPKAARQIDKSDKGNGRRRNARRKKFLTTNEKI